MNPVLGHIIVIAVLAVIVFFCARSIIRDILNEFISLQENNIEEAKSKDFILLASIILQQYYKKKTFL